MKKGDISKFIRRRIFCQTIQQARKSFANVPLDELQKTIDEVVDDIRARHYRARAKRR